LQVKGTFSKFSCAVSSCRILDDVCNSSTTSVSLAEGGLRCHGCAVRSPADLSIRRRKCVVPAFGMAVLTASGRPLLAGTDRRVYAITHAKVHGHKFPAYDSALLGYCLAIPAQAMRTQRADALPGR
jgi:hypothetical protein